MSGVVLNLEAHSPTERHEDAFPLKSHLSSRVTGLRNVSHLLAQPPIQPPGASPFLPAVCSDRWGHTGHGVILSVSQVQAMPSL